MNSDDPPKREPYVFGPIAVFQRIVRWHRTAPLWQVLLVTALLPVFIVITYVNQFGGLSHP